MIRVQLHLALFGTQILPPPVALFLTLAFVVFLFRRDLRQQPNVTGALWIPIVWVLLIGSRSVIQWLHTFGIMNLASTEEGNPIDAFIYLSLMIAGLCVLNQRRVNLAEVVQKNGWLIAFLVYCLIAIVWSDYPFVAFKRWIKILGHPVMALILFTEPDFDQALTTLMKRSAYLLVPFSIVFIKYYPEIGRAAPDEWTGLATSTGVTQGKNALGCDCLVLGFFFFNHLLRTWRADRTITRRNEILLTLGLLVMVGWLFQKAHSATSFLSFLVAVMVVLLVGRQWVNKRLIGTYAIAALIGLGAAQLTFGIFERIVALSGHSSTFVGRTELWRQLLAIHTNPIFGVGFESFWLGDRLLIVHQGRSWQPNEAHNGYLETYLNMGLVGVFMLACVIVATFRKIRVALLQDLDWGRYRLGLLVAIVFYNATEATFRGLNLVWFVFYIIAMDYGNVGFASENPDSAEVALGDERDLAYHEDGVGVYEEARSELGMRE